MIYMSTDDMAQGKLAMIQPYVAFFYLDVHATVCAAIIHIQKVQKGRKKYQLQKKSLFSPPIQQRPKQLQ